MRQWAKKVVWNSYEKGEEESERTGELGKWARKVVQSRLKTNTFGGISDGWYSNAICEKWQGVPPYHSSLTRQILFGSHLDWFTFFLSQFHTLVLSDSSSAQSTALPPPRSFIFNSRSLGLLSTTWWCQKTWSLKTLFLFAALLLIERPIFIY